MWVEQELLHNLPLHVFHTAYENLGKYGVQFLHHFFHSPQYALFRRQNWSATNLSNADVRKDIVDSVTAAFKQEVDGGRKTTTPLKAVAHSLSLHCRRVVLEIFRADGEATLFNVQDLAGVGATWR